MEPTSFLLSSPLYVILSPEGVSIVRRRGVFPHTLKAVSYSLLISDNFSGLRTENLLPLCAHALAVILLEFAGGEFLPLPGSKGRVFPLRSAELTSKPAHARWIPHRFQNGRSGATGSQKTGERLLADTPLFAGGGGNIMAMGRTH
jgi:hypothetical protein